MFQLDSLFRKHEVRGQGIAIMHFRIHKIGHACNNKVGYQYILAAIGSNRSQTRVKANTSYSFISFANHLICIFMNIHKTYPLSLSDFLQYILYKGDL